MPGGGRSAGRIRPRRTALEARTREHSPARHRVRQPGPYRHLAVARRRNRGAAHLPLHMLRDGRFRGRVPGRRRQGRAGAAGYYPQDGQPHQRQADRPSRMRRRGVLPRDVRERIRQSGVRGLHGQRDHLQMVCACAGGRHQRGFLEPPRAQRPVRGVRADEADGPPYAQVPPLRDDGWRGSPYPRFDQYEREQR